MAYHYKNIITCTAINFFSVTLQKKQQKINTTKYSKIKLIFIPKTFQSKQGLVLLSKILRKHIRIYNKENKSNVNKRDL